MSEVFFCLSKHRLGQKHAFKHFLCQKHFNFLQFLDRFKIWNASDQTVRILQFCAQKIQTPAIIFVWEKMSYHELLSLELMFAKCSFFLLVSFSDYLVSIVNLFCLSCKYFSLFGSPLKIKIVYLPLKWYSVKLISPWRRVVKTVFWLLATVYM